MDDSKSGDGAVGDGTGISAATTPATTTTTTQQPGASSASSVVPEEQEQKSPEVETQVQIRGRSSSVTTSAQPPSRYESQKRRDWNTFLQYLKNHKPPLTLARCSGANVIEFLKYLDQFGKTKVHVTGCQYFGHPNPPAPCPCPSKQAWGSLDALIGRLRAAYEENGGKPESNPFGVRPVRIYLREVRESQATARGIPYEKKKRKRATVTAPTITGEITRIGDVAGSSSNNSGVGGSSSEAVLVIPISSSCTASTTTTTTSSAVDSSSAEEIIPPTV